MHAARSNLIRKRFGGEIRKRNGYSPIRLGQSFPNQSGTKTIKRAAFELQTINNILNYTINT